MKLRWIPIALAAVLFSGCAVMQQPEMAQVQSEVSWEDRQQQLGALKRWIVEGRAAFRTEKEGGQSGFRWLFSPNEQAFHLHGVLGAGALTLRSGPEGAVVKQGQLTYRGRDPQLLLLQISGFHFPVDEARYWILGMPAPGQPVSRLILDDRARLQRLNQSGWSLEIKRYQQVGMLELPALMVMRQGDIQVKLRLAQWVLEESE